MVCVLHPMLIVNNLVNSDSPGELPAKFWRSWRGGHNQLVQVVASVQVEVRH
ncbi:hypothetical protein M404DRAFT_998822 [Pisolithus tinctorius Marx 270]|uniref:Uncharacterized protein n=1 Tax=Pisolithus tinctorius Marx 270 TaxID=870435 RepID=A0A0C3P0S1_PISTI|nr:hypothetical protein M404DRAFT_998822 [Pisolithus tinctorius Marx 270]